MTTTLKNSSKMFIKPRHSGHRLEHEEPANFTGGKPCSPMVRARSGIRSNLESCEKRNGRERKKYIETKTTGQKPGEEMEKLEIVDQPSRQRNGQTIVCWYVDIIPYCGSDSPSSSVINCRLIPGQTSPRPISMHRLTSPGTPPLDLSLSSQASQRQ